MKAGAGAAAPHPLLSPATKSSEEGQEEQRVAGFGAAGKQGL